MNRKKLGIISSALALLVLTVWFTQGYDAGAQTATAAKGANANSNSASTSTTVLAAPGKNANAKSGTSQRQNNATLAAQTGQRHIAATSTAHNDKSGSNTNNNATHSQSPNQTRARIKPTPLEPRAEPYALMANSGSATVRFSVRLIGDAVPSTTVYLRQSGAEGVIALNDQGMDGDIVAGDNIHGGNIVLDTSRLQPDTCLSYEAFFTSDGIKVVSAPSQLCVSAFPIRTAASNPAHLVEFSDGSKAIADEVIFTVNKDTNTASIRSLASDIGATVVGSIPSLNLYQLKLPTPVNTSRLQELVAKLQMRPEVRAATVNAVGSFAFAPNDPEYASQHGLQRIRAQDVWDIGANGSGVIVTVLDNGLDRTHPDFGLATTDPAYVSPADCQLAENDCIVGANNDTGPTAGHGTQVAGIIAAKTNNNSGVAGVAYGSKIHSIRVDLTVDIANPYLTFTRIATGFDDAASYTASHGAASIINASFSFPSSGFNWDPICTAINNAVLEGPMDPVSGLNTGNPRAIVVNAVGNSGSNGYYYPARCNDFNPKLTRKDLFITVANSISSTTIDPSCANATLVDQRCGGTTTGISNTSNYGAWVDIAAPGMSIRTTNVGGGYTTQTGTSISAPMVAGAAAILKQCGVPLDQIETTLKNSANVTVPFPDGSSAPRLDIYRALQYVNHDPSAVLLSNTSLNEGTNTTSGIEVGTLTPTDADTCDKHTYTITGGVDSAKFSIGGTAFDRLILTDGVLHYATKPSYSVTMRVTDFFGKFYDQVLTVNVSTVNHTPTISSQTFRVNEGSANGTAVGTVLASDPDSGNVLSYSITAGNTSNAFSINPSTGALSVNNATALVYATNPTFSLTVTVTDGGGLSANATVTVNVNKAPAISNQTFSINEGTANGTSVGAVVASDAGDTLSYSITAGNTSGAFSINSSTGVLSVGNSAALVYATNPTFGLTVQVTDSGSLTATATVTVNVNPPGTPANNPPVIANQTFVVADSAANGTVVGSVIASDPDAGNTLSYSITGGNTGNAFSINTSTGVLSVASSAAVSYASNPTFSLSVRVADNGGLSATATVTVNVNAPVTPPPPSGGGGGGGGCSVMPVGASPDYSLALAILALLAYGVRRRLAQGRCF